MNKLTLVGFLLFTSCSVTLADEYISDAYYDVNDSSIITFDETNIKEENSTVANEKELSEKLSPYLSALKEARENNKIVLLVIRATNCQYCDRMEAETLSESSVKSALEQDFVTVYYNEDLEPLPLGIQSGITPNFIFVDKDENIINMYPGMRSPKEFKEALAEILSK